MQVNTQPPNIQGGSPDLHAPVGLVLVEEGDNDGTNVYRPRRGVYYLVFLQRPGQYQNTLPSEQENRGSETDYATEVRGPRGPQSLLVHNHVTTRRQNDPVAYNELLPSEERQDDRIARIKRDLQCVTKSFGCTLSSVYKVDTELRLDEDDMVAEVIEFQLSMNHLD